MATSESLRTSKDVYDRIKWDLSNKTDIMRYIVVYLDRFDGMKEMPLVEFEPGGDIPWHRIYQFRCGDEVIWDRKLKLDRVFGSGKPQGSRRNRKSNKSSESRKETILDSWPPLNYVGKPFFSYCKSENRWIQALEASSDDISQFQPVSKLKILSYNILFGLYEHEQNTYEDDRLKLLITELEHQNADVVCLQEVTHYNWEFLLDQKLIQDNYFVTENLENGQDMNGDFPRYGQVILSRLPVLKTAKTPLTNSTKFTQIALLANGPRSHFLLANVHLTSTKHELSAEEKNAGIERRVEQMKSVLRLGPAAGPVPVFVVGDYNYADDTPEAPLCEKEMELRGFTDIWRALKPNDPGITFNPDSNQIAHINSTVNFNPRRLDRIILRDVENIFCPVKIDIIGTESQKSVDNVDLLPSDHYGLVCELSLRETFAEHCALSQSMELIDISEIIDFPLARTTCLCLVPPKDGPLYGIVQKFRAHSDPSFARWPPHLSIFWKFIKDSNYHLETAKEGVKMVVENLKPEPLKVTFARVGIFDQGKGGFVFLFPDMHFDEKSISGQKQLESKVKPLYFCENQKNLPDFEVHQDADFGDHPIAKLYKALRKKFPKCGDRPSLVPHLTLGKFASLAIAKKFALELQAEWVPVSCCFSQLEIMTRIGEGPFRNRFSVELGDQIFPRSTTFFPRSSVLLLRDKLIADLTGTLKQYLPQSTKFSVFTVGSLALETHGSNSDIDLSICATTDSKIVTNAVEKLSECSKLVFKMEHVISLDSESGNLLNLVRLVERTTGRLVEVGIAEVSDELIEKLTKGNYEESGETKGSRVKEDFDESVAEKEIRSLDTASMLAVSGILDARHLRNRIFNDEFYPVTKRVVNTVKNWAKTKGLIGLNFGYPTSCGWAVMCIYVIDRLSLDVLDWTKHDGTDPNHVVHHTLMEFFKTFSDIGAFNSGKVYGITETNGGFAENMGPADQVFCVPCPTFPHKNQCSKITKSTAEILRKECLAAALALERLPFEFREYVTAENFTNTDFSHSDMNLELTLTYSGEGVTMDFSKYTPEFVPSGNLGHLPKPLLQQMTLAESQFVRLYLAIERHGRKKYPVVIPKAEPTISYPHQITWFTGINGVEEIDIKSCVDGFIKDFKLQPGMCLKYHVH